MRVFDYQGNFQGADLEFYERGAKHSSGSLKPGFWGHSSPPEFIGYLVFQVSKYSQVQQIPYYIMLCQLEVHVHQYKMFIMKTSNFW